MEVPSEKFRDFIPQGSEDKIKRMFDLMFNEDCRKTEDCEELVSPCCGGDLVIVFGSLPVEVECKICGTKAFLRDLVTSEKV